MKVLFFPIFPVLVGTLKLHNKVDFIPHPSFIACATPGPCAERKQNVTNVYKADLLANVKKKVAQITEAGEVPVILQIGIDGLANSAKFTDVHLYQTVLSLLSGTHTVRLVLVDPSSKKNDATWENVHQLPIKSTQVQLINSLIMGQCTKGTQSFYRWSKQIERDFGIRCISYRGWGSFDKDRPAKALWGFTLQGGLNSPVYKACQQSGSDQPAAYAALFNAPNRSAYLEEIQYPCDTPSSLLAKMNASFSNLAMVVIDAEGADVAIVNAILDDDKELQFAPGYFQFEQGGKSLLKMVIKKLRARSFVVGSDFGDDASNVIILPPR